MSDYTLSEQGRRLEAELKKIDWSLRHCGCGIYRVHNEKGLSTAFEVYTYHIEVSNKRELFGGAFRGSIYFDLRHCKIEVNDNADTLNITPDQMDSPSWIAFYNFDKKKKDA